MIDRIPRVIRMGLIPFAGAILIGLVGWWSDVSVHNSIQTKITEDLRTILDADVTALKIWIQSQQTTATMLARDAQVQQLIADLHRRFESSQDQLETLRKAPEQMALRACLQARISGCGYPGYSVIASDGSIMGAGLDPIVGLQVLTQNQNALRLLFRDGEPQLITPFQPPPEASVLSENRPIMAVAVPVIDPRNPENIMAALGLIIEPDEDFTHILSIARSGQSGETYAFDQQGILLSASRFEDMLRRVGLLPAAAKSTSVLQLQLLDPGVDLTHQALPSQPRSTLPLTLLAASAIEGQSGIDIEGHRDYRGIRVIGAWEWLPEYRFGVGTQIDFVEAYEALLGLRRIFYTLFALLALCATAMFFISFVSIRLQQRVAEAEMEARKLGQYTLDKKIGEGGMGSVYKAHHTLLRRPTAVKLLKTSQSSRAAVARFEREVQLTSQLYHPNTIQIFDYGHTPHGIFYYAMEYLDGINLKELVLQFGPQPEGRIIHILQQACGSLREAHEAGLVHRDIKPANLILLRQSAVFDRVKLLDFGLIKDLDQEQESEEAADVTFANSVTGTPVYMSPESIQNPLQVDGRSDLYSLGALGYYLLTGEEVFTGRSVYEIFHGHTTLAPQPPSARTGQKYSPDLERVIMCCLEKNPAQRPASAVELARQLSLCAASHSWQESDAAQWWRRYSEEIEKKSMVAATETSSQFDHTLKVDLEDR